VRFSQHDIFQGPEDNSAPQSRGDEPRLVKKSAVPKGKRPADIKIKSTSNLRREEYVRPPYTLREPISLKPLVELPEPQAVPCHVNRGKDQRVSALPPPPPGRKTASISLRFDGQGEEEKEENHRKRGQEDRGRGDDDRGNGSDGSSTLKEENDEEYESAPEEPWPDEIWNAAEEQRSQEEAQAVLEIQRRREEAAQVEARQADEIEKAEEVGRFQKQEEARMKAHLDGHGWSQGYHRVHEDPQWLVDYRGVISFLLKGSRFGEFEERLPTNLSSAKGKKSKLARCWK
jgi:hypothetical protein